MNYSRRQLEAFGETIGECVTRKEGGRIIYGGGGSGGGSAPPASQTQISDLPEWAKPYAKETLGKAQALTDINQNPYQQYQGERIAGFAPLQQQAFKGAQQLEPSQLGQQAGQMAGAATMGALGTSYDPYRMGQFTADRAAQYMNPFVEMAMEPQLREAQRASDILGVQQAGEATRAGAFGGGRQAIVEAERQRNLGQQLGDIRARGYMSAFDQAQQQFAREQQLREQSRQYGAGLGLQGLQTALQGAGQMGQLGATEFGQRQAALGMQQQFGAQQQAQEQQRLSQNYQDFMNQQRYPYQQLEFMSNIMRGTPMGTVQSMYAPGPSPVQNLASLGLGAYGFKQLGMFAEGGDVKEYALGGSVTSDRFVADALDSLSDEQLAQARENAITNGDANKLKLIDAELADRARSRAAENRSIQAGLGGAFNQIPSDTQERMMAGGGIVAFAGDEDDNDDETGQLVSGDDGYVRTPGGLYVLGSELEGDSDLAVPSLGSPEMHRAAASRALRAGQRIGQFQPTVMTPEQERAYVQQQFNLEKELAGPNEAAKAMRAYFAQAGDERAEGLRQAKAIGALKAAGAILQPGGLMRGLGAAGSAFAESYDRALQADRAEKRALKMAEFNLMDAERKERMGQAKSATAALAARRQNLQRADKLHLDKLNYQQQGAAAVARATRPTAQPKPAAERAPKEFEVAVSTYLPEVQALYPELSPARQKAKAFQLYQERKGPGLAGVTTRTDAAERKSASDNTAKRLLSDIGYHAARRKNDTAAMERREKEIFDIELYKAQKGAAPGVIKLD